MGIDPGKGGGFCYNYGTMIVLHPFKDLESLKLRLLGLTFDYSVLEKSSSSPQQGVVSSFSQGENFGLWQGILATLQEDPVNVVLPAEWSRWIIQSLEPHEEPYPVKTDSTTRAEWYQTLKHYNQRLAQSRFPDLKVTLKTADAVLIWQYAMHRKANPYGKGESQTPSKKRAIPKKGKTLFETLKEEVQ